MIDIYYICLNDTVWAVLGSLSRYKLWVLDTYDTPYTSKQTPSIFM